MKACSFLPAATQIIYELGLEDILVGVTFECLSNKPKVVRSYLEGHDLSSHDIDALVSHYKAENKSLYYIDEDLLATLCPTLIFTQDVCEVCQIETSQVQRAVAKLGTSLILVPLLPRTLEDVFHNISTIACFLQQSAAGECLVASLRKRITQLTANLQTNRAPIKNVLFLEWMDPFYHCGHWIPDQIALAHGHDELGNQGGYSGVVSFEQLAYHNPEVIFIVPCGFDPARAVKEAPILCQHAGWEHLKAVQQNQVYFLDAQYFTQPSSTLVDGIELLAGLLHPTLFEIPDRLKNAYLRFESTTLG